MDIDRLNKTIINGEEYEFIDNLEINSENIKKDTDYGFNFVENLTISCSGSLKISDELLSIIKKF